MSFSDLSKTLYEEKSSSEISSKVIESLAKIAELYWEKMPLEKRKRVILRKELNGKKTLTIEYMPKTSFELMEYAKKDSFDLKKKVEINLEEEARKLMDDLQRNGAYFRFRTYVKNLVPPEEVLIRMGYGKRMYEILKNSLENLFIKQEQKIKNASLKKEILKMTPFLFLLALLFFVSFSTTGFASLPSQQFNTFFFLLLLFCFLIFFLFFY
jgi:hypothetical protein